MPISLYSFVLISQFVIYSVYALPNSGQPQNNLRNTVQNTIQEVIPLEARDFYENLTRNDRQVLERVLSKAPNYGSIGELLTDLRNGSNTLYDKAVQMVTSIRQTIAKLSPPARAFVDQSVEQIQNALGKGFSLDLLKNEAKQFVERYRILEDETKIELRAAFPMVAAIVDNAIIQTIASGIFGIGNQQNE